MCLASWPGRLRLLQRLSIKASLFVHLPTQQFSCIEGDLIDLSDLINIENCPFLCHSRGWLFGGWVVATNSAESAEFFLHHLRVSLRIVWRRVVIALYVVTGRIFMARFLNSLHIFSGPAKFGCRSPTIEWISAICLPLCRCLETCPKFDPTGPVNYLHLERYEWIDGVFTISAPRLLSMAHWLAGGATRFRLFSTFP